MTRLKIKVFNAVGTNNSRSIEKDECKKCSPQTLPMGDMPEQSLQEQVTTAMSDIDAQKDGKST